MSGAKVYILHVILKELKVMTTTKKNFLVQYLRILSQS